MNVINLLYKKDIFIIFHCYKTQLKTNYNLLT